MNIPAAKLIIVAGITTVRNSAVKEAGSPTIIRAETKKIVPLAKVPSGKRIYKIIFLYFL